MPAINLPESTVAEIKDILRGFLKKCDIGILRDAQMDQKYLTSCLEDAQRRGCDIVDVNLDKGIAMGHITYRYLKNEPTRVFIGVLTAIIGHIDDNYRTFADGLEDFVDRFLRQFPQRYPILDQVATMLHEIPNHWGPVASNMILTSIFDYFTSTMVDNAIEGMEIQTGKSPGFPGFMRRMSGITLAYTIMVFPPELDFKTWIQVVPDLMHWIEYGNDVLSFYKEELAGETLNFVSMNASSHGISKLEALRRLADETADHYLRGSELLKSDAGAWDCYRSFAVAYVEFHFFSTGRYKLDRLNL